MITVSIEDDKVISQRFYEAVLKDLSLASLSCTCGSTGKMVRHGYYKRHFKVNSEKIKLRILRVKCKECGSTHAILLSIIVPYSQVLLNDQIKIIQNYENRQSNNNIMNSNFLIDENTIAGIIRKYKRCWRYIITLNKFQSIKDIAIHCFQKFNCQFMQVKNTSNVFKSKR